MGLAKGAFRTEQLTLDTAKPASRTRCAFFCFKVAELYPGFTTPET
jgi:hypothetical protein